MKTRATLAALAALAIAWPAVGQATPSTQIWIPSPDIQRFNSLHLNYDVYASPGKSTVLMLGPTAGVLPWKRVQAEVGFDLMFQGNEELDRHPFYLHAKLGTPEGSFFRGAPSFSMGVYNAGVQPGLTTQNIAYAISGRTLPVLGRFSAGIYQGNESLLRDSAGGPANRGVLASWDRTMSEISEKLWMSVDLQSGESALGALSGGAAWAFTENVSVILGFDHYLAQEVTGNDTFTVQLDVNL